MSEGKRNRNIRRTVNLLRRGIRHLFFHNGWLKLIAIVISVVFWAGLFSLDDTVTRDKVFHNVNVSVTGTETMKSNHYIVVSNLEEILKNVSIIVDVPQKQYDKAEAGIYNVRLDLSRIKGTGEQEVKLQSSNSSIYGKVVSINPSSVKLDVEEYIIRTRIPVSATVNGDIPDGWYMTTPSVVPALISVSGPRSVVEKISRARVFISTEEIEWKEETVVTSAEIRLYNRTGEEVDSSLLSISSSSLTIDSALIEANLLPSKSFDTEKLIRVNGKPAEGYSVGRIRISPETVSVAARQEVLEQMTDLSLEKTTVNINDMNETAVFQLKVQKPSDDAIISNETITVTVEINEDKP